LLSASDALYNYKYIELTTSHVLKGLSHVKRRSRTNHRLWQKLHDADR